jgi:glyoxylase-like metal-dependent hydrolase (beta-lactamase superfamily II)
MLKQGDCKLIEIKQQLPGFDQFVGSWLYQGDITLLIDVGPSSSADQLTETVVALGVDRVDYILLTHIHIDHAGGVAQCLRQFPMARVICHNKGIRHLVDPSKLWDGSLKVLKEIAETYGQPEPVQEERFVLHTEVPVEELAVIETPGHAPHHLSFSYKGHLFSGEAAGNYYSLGDSDYLRPATPPRFFLEVFLSSLDKLMALEDQHICYAHFGDAESSQHMLTRFRAQVVRWHKLIRQEMSRDPDGVMTRCVNRLLEEDPDLRAYAFMPPDIRKRERFFITNSVRGYLDFLQNRD